jgi:hypothetical protein
MGSGRLYRLIESGGREMMLMHCRSGLYVLSIELRKSRDVVDRYARLLVSGEVQCVRVRGSRGAIALGVGHKGQQLVGEGGRYL